MVRLRNTAEFFDIAAQATEAATRQLLIDTAKREHAKVLGSARVPFTRTVDGQKGRREEDVKTFGVIQYNYLRLPEVVEFAMQTLFDFSPVKEGDYRDGHTLFLNGIEVSNLKDWKSGDDVVILNLVPYTRKIEQGRMKMRVAGSDHVYERAERAVSRRYGNIARTDFVYRSYQAGKGRVVDYMSASSARARFGKETGNKALERERNTRVPALVFGEYA